MLLYPNFLHDEAEYLAAEQFWRELWRGLAPPDSWVSPWLSTAFANGQPFRDGNPIFSAQAKVAHRALKVVQAGDEGDSSAIEAWLDRTEDEDGAPLTVLVVWCVLSEATAAAAEELIGRWLADRGEPTNFATQHEESSP